MIRGTTPEHTFLMEFDITDSKKLQVIYCQDGKEVLIKNKEDCIIEQNSLKVQLSQQETFKFDSAKNVSIQIRVLTEEGKAMASEIMTVGVGRCLSDEVLA